MPPALNLDSIITYRLDFGWPCKNIKSVAGITQSLLEVPETYRSSISSKQAKEKIFILWLLNSGLATSQKALYGQFSL